VRSHQETYLVLLDIRMPKVDGIEVLRRLKADPEFRKLPVIMLTTTEDSREVERCHELGCSVYIQKPVDYDRFAEAIRRLGLFVPLLLVPPLGSVLSPTRGVADPEPRHLLVVDDDEGLLILMAETLRAEGCIVETARTAKAARTHPRYPRAGADDPRSEPARRPAGRV
jgi:CheY-like chemotaxis protein